MLLTTTDRGLNDRGISFRTQINSLRSRSRDRYSSTGKSVMSVGNVESEAAFDTLAEKGSLVVHFAADWAPQCKQMDEVLTELAQEPALKSVRFCRVEAESLPELSLRHNITAVPSFVLLCNGKAVGRVDGARAAELTKKVRTLAQQGGVPLAVPAATEEDISTRLKKLITRSPCMLFMKGTPDEPRCGFSRQIIEILDRHKVVYSTFDILSDEEVRQDLKTYSDWPTYPQVYAHGELVGGLDIVKEMDQSGELASALPCKKSQAEVDERLKTLTSSSPVLVFMKGSPTQPRCGFSRQLMEILNALGTNFKTFDILGDEEVRQELKRYADFPTYPQVWVGGELIGGLDIVNELQESGELKDALAVQ